MVLESLFGQKTLRKHPFMVFIQTMVLASVGIWAGYILFPESASIAALALSVIGLVPVFQNIIVKEEEEEEGARGAGGSLGFWERHFDLVALFAWMFLGLVAAYFIWFSVLPTAVGDPLCVGGACFEAPARDAVFAEQAKTISFLRGHVTEPIQAPTRSACFGAGKSVWGCTQFIFSNNAVVLGLAIILSFLYGAGAIFLLAWNASVIGVILGEKALELQGIHWGLVQGIGLLPHGLPEIGAYLLGALAGGIIGVAIMRGRYNTPAFEQVAKDFLLTIILAYAVLFIAALIEAIAIVGM